MTLTETSEAHYTGPTYLIELRCSNAKPHDQLTHTELLNLWAALSA